MEACTVWQGWNYMAVVELRPDAAFNEAPTVPMSAPKVLLCSRV